MSTTHNHPGSRNIPRNSVIQRVEAHEPKNTSILHINSFDRVDTTKYSDPRFQTTGDIMKADIAKIAVNEVDISYNIPNINSQNNVIKFQLGPPPAIPTTYTFVIPSRFYTVPDLMTTITGLLTAASAATFTLSNPTHGLYGIKCDEPFRFISSSHLDRAECLSGLIITEAFSDVIMSVIAEGLYTRYLDFLSVDIRENQVLPNLFTANNTYGTINHFYRHYIEDGTTPFREVKQIVNLSYVPTSPKTKKIFKMQVFNQFGDLVYSPPVAFGGETYDVEFLKYSLKLSITT